jgi:copper chaperone CopZ
MLRSVIGGLALTVLLGGLQVQAGEVVVTGVHICCPLCVDGLNEAFKETAGVSEVKVEKDAKKVTFTAADADAARAGVQALARAGYAGKAVHGGEELPFPGSRRRDAKANEVTIRGLHNCCGGCAKTIEAALKGVAGVEKVSLDNRVATVTGKEVSQKALIDALHAVGLHGNIPMPRVNQQ